MEMRLADRWRFVLDRIFVLKERVSLMKKIHFLALFAAVVFWTACSSEPMTIVTGKEFIQNRSVVADTGSVFHSSDSFVMQFRYGKAFDFSKIKWEIFNASGKVIGSKTSTVNGKQDSYTVLVSSHRHGGIANAAEIFHAKEGSFTLRFSNGDVGTVLLEKQIRVVLNSQKIDGE